MRIYSAILSLANIAVLMYRFNWWSATGLALSLVVVVFYPRKGEQ